MMVAYSFNKRFVPQIAAGTKRQTIRLPRKRHARPGERLQLYTGMRTRYCQKIIPDPICSWATPLSILFEARRIVSIELSTETIGGGVRVKCLDQFARQDGFEGIEDMSEFWARTHGTPEHFVGVLICWDPEGEEASDD